MANRRWIVVGVAASTAVAALVAILAIAGSAPPGTPAARASHSASSTPSTAAEAPTRGAPGPTGTTSDARVLNYVSTLPTVHDVTADTVGEFTDLVCATLRSPKMSPSFYDKVIAIEKQGYSLSAAQATGLLRAVAQSDCPDAVRVVNSGGARASSVPAR